MASGRIKGITIDIGANTTDLQKALSGVDKSLKQTESSLRDVNKLLKLDPGNTELLTQKQKLLGDAVNQTKERLETLKNASEQAKEALEKGAMTQDKYDALQREIAETEQKLEGLTKAANESSSALESISATGQKLKDVGGKIESAGKSLTKNVTAPILAVGGASVAAFNEVDNGLDTIAKKTGATGEELRGLEETAKNVFGSMPVEMDDVGSAIGEINTRFGLTGAALEEMTKDFLKFSNVNDVDVTQSVEAVHKIMQKFNLDTSKTNDVLGLLTRASQKSGISIDTLENSLESNGAALKELGFDVTETVNLLAQMESNGVDTSTAMTALSKAVQNATKDGKDAETALREQIDAIKNATTDTEALQLATELFGKKGAAEMAQAIREDKVSIDDLSGSLSDYSDVVETTFTDTQDASDEAKVAFNNLKLAGSELGGAIGTVLTPVIGKLADAFKGISNWFKSLSPQQQEMVVKILLITATIGPLLIVIGKVIAAIGTILTVLPAIKGAILAVNAALAANPIAAVVLAITALIAIFVTLWNNCDAFRQFWIDLWDALQETVSGVLDFLETGFDLLVGTFENLGSGFEQVGQGIKDLFTSIGDAFSSLGDTLGDIATSISDAFQTMGDTVGTIFNTMWDVIKGVINTIIGGINGMISAIESALNAIIGALNSLYWEIPSWVPGLGGYGFGFDIPEAHFARIPELAQGAVIQPNHPFLAMLGDQKAGTNIEAPLNTIKQALVEALQTNGANSEVIIPVYIGYDRIETIIAKANTNLNFISGGR